MQVVAYNIASIHSFHDDTLAPERQRTPLPHATRTPHPCTPKRYLPAALPCDPSADRSRSLNRAVGDRDAAEGHRDGSAPGSFHLHRARLRSGARTRLGQLHAMSKAGPTLLSDAARDEISRAVASDAI